MTKISDNEHLYGCPYINNFQYMPIHTHITKCNNRNIKYIVLHYTAGASSKTGSAERTRNVFLNRKASADFIVDDTTILQVNPDLYKYYCWAVGDGKGKYGITNKNSVSIEMCSTLKKGTSAAVPNHTGWSISEDVLKNTIKLVRWLMKILNIDIDHVVRHYDASRKSCPGIVGWNGGPLYNEDGTKTNTTNIYSVKWVEFKQRIQNCENIILNDEEPHVPTEQHHEHHHTSYEHTSYEHNTNEHHTNEHHTNEHTSYEHTSYENANTNTSTNTETSSLGPYHAPANKKLPYTINDILKRLKDVNAYLGNNIDTNYDKWNNISAIWNNNL